MTKNITRKLISRKSLLDSFFSKLTLDSSSDIRFQNSDGVFIDRVVVYCHDLPGLIAYKKILENSSDSDDMLNVVGMDDGKGMLKITLNWSKVIKYRGRNQLMGPKCGLILAIVANVPESYHNIKILMNLTNINEIEYHLSQDLKLTNIIIGITSHTSKYPCPYGECYKDNKSNEWYKGTDRTIKNLRSNQRKWCEAPARQNDRRLLKEFKNCENVPLISCDDPDTPILYVIPPPPLHLILLGPVNHIINHLKQRYSQIVNILDTLHIQRSKYHGKTFEGNQCRQILQKIHKLNIPIEYKEYKQVLIDLKALHTVCNSNMLPHNYVEVLDKFSSSWQSLKDKFGISTTPKLHIILDHLEDYFNETNRTFLKKGTNLLKICTNLFLRY